MKSLSHNVLLILTTALGLSTTMAAAQQLSIGSETINSGGVATVDLNISGLTPGSTALGTFDVNVGFDPSVLSFASASYGDPILGDQLNFNGFAFNSTSPGVGTTEMFELSLDDSSTLTTLQASSFTLATLTFDALSTGSSALSLSVNALGDQDGNALTAALRNGSITVTGAATKAPEIEATSAASALSLLLGLLAVLRGRRTLR